VAAADRSRARRTLLILALMCAAPVIASYLAYYWFRPSARTNYGELLDPKPTPDAVGTRLDGERFKLTELRGKWVLLAIDPSGCDDECRGKLYATRQARAIQGREQDRIVRVWVQGVDAPAPASDLLEQHPGLIVVRLDAAQWALLPEAAMGSRRIYLIDPLGNLVLAYPASPDIKRMARDLERLLRASRIG